MERKSQSTINRRKGNALYVSSSAEGLSFCLQKSRLQDALMFYEKAKNESFKQDETCSASKNIAMASKKIALLLSKRNEPVRERHYYFKESLSHFDTAYKFSECKPRDWVDALLTVFHETMQESIDDINLITFEQKVIALEDYAKYINNVFNLRCELFIEIAQLTFHEGIFAMQNKDYKKCLYQMKECYRPIEEAHKYGGNYEFVKTEVRVFEQDVFIHTCIAESAQAKNKGDNILQCLLMDEENLQMDMVWKVVDLYKEAILLTRENDMEAEAIALSQLGNVFDKILKNKMKAKDCFRRSIQLAISLQPRTFDSEDWFKHCLDVLERYQKEVVQQESEMWNKERASYLEELKDEIEAIETAKTSDYASFLKHIYTVHPPRVGTLSKLPSSGSDTYRNDMKVLFRKAVIHFHPDKVDVNVHGKQLKVLYEEITKLLTNTYELFK